MEKAAKAFIESKADYIVALSGGSPLDVAKAVAVVAKYGGSITDYGGDRIYNFLIAFGKLYDKLSDAEKKEFMGTFVESVELYPERLEMVSF